MRSQSAVLAFLAVLAATGHLWAATPELAPGKGPGIPAEALFASDDPEAEAPVTQADLARLPGSYANQEMGLTFKVELLERRLRVTVTQGPAFPPFLLIPTSPTRFRAEGEGLAPGLMVSFQMTEGRATALILAQPGMPEAVLTRTE